MLDHIGFSVTDYSHSLAFYRLVLATLGYELVMEVTLEQSGAGAHAGFGRDGKPSFWIGSGTGAVSPGSAHIALVAPNRSAVDAFHRSALAAGARDHGAPGLRPHYHAHYYAAFVLDPDGYNIEAVCHHPED